MRSDVGFQMRFWSVTGGLAAGKNKVSATVIVAILLPVVVVATIIVALAICFVKKRSKNYNVVPVGSGEDFATLDSLQYDLATLQLATNSFSEENKIAEGGFGGVYKSQLSFLGA
ncbi:hypothetical protein BVRB_8g187070 [Beta vulgaris subsp. vulgaris]|nr:hypothetical protein BVRB_8g187070 [Beta vulgaris subsp. vulgaris]